MIFLMIKFKIIDKKLIQMEKQIKILKEVKIKLSLYSIKQQSVIMTKKKKD